MEPYILIETSSCFAIAALALRSSLKAFAFDRLVKSGGIPPVPVTRGFKPIRWLVALCRRSSARSRIAEAVGAVDRALELGALLFGKLSKAPERF